MEPNRALPTAQRWAAAAVLAAALFTLSTAASVRFAATSTWWWERGFERYQAAQRINLPAGEVSRIGAEVRDYFRSEDERLNVQRPAAAGGGPVFSEREIEHMVDVKRLMARTWDAGWAAFGLIAAFAAAALLRRRDGGVGWLFDRIAAAGSAVVTLTAALAIIAVTGFDGAFRQFHLLFFTNDLWQLTRADALIQLFPQRFFFDTTLLIGASILAPAALLALAGWIRTRRAGGATRTSRSR